MRAGEVGREVGVVAAVVEVVVGEDVEGTRVVEGTRTPRGQEVMIGR